MSACATHSPATSSDAIGWRRRKTLDEENEETKTWEDSMSIRHVAARLAVSLALALAFFSGAQAETKIRFTLDWLPGSYHAPFFIALYKGYYKAEGLDVSIDAGKGSGRVVRELATGVYDIGYPDINVLTE